jgi:hypothetical protein
VEDHQASSRPRQSPKATAAQTGLHLHPAAWFPVSGRSADPGRCPLYLHRAWPNRTVSGWLPGVRQRCCESHRAGVGHVGGIGQLPDRTCNQEHTSSLRVVRACLAPLQRSRRAPCRPPARPGTVGRAPPVALHRRNQEPPRSIPRPRPQGGRTPKIPTSSVTCTRPSRYDPHSPGGATC